MRLTRFLSALLLSSLIAAPAADAGRATKPTARGAKVGKGRTTRTTPTATPGDEATPLGRAAAARARTPGKLAAGRTKLKPTGKVRGRTKSIRRSDAKVEPADQVMVNELEAMLGRDSAESLRDAAFLPDLSTVDKDLAADLGPPAPGKIRLANGVEVPIRSERSAVAFKALKATRPATRRGKGPRKVFIDGGGPTGAISAIQAFNLGLDVTITELRGQNTLPIVWNNRQASRDIMKLIDPALERKVFAGQAGALTSGEVVGAGKPIVGKPELREAGDGQRISNHPLGIGASPSTFQTQAKGEVEAYWAHLYELEAAEKTRAAAEHRKPRLTIYRGYQVQELPVKGNQRGVVIQQFKEVLQKGDGKTPVLGKNGKPIQKPYKAGAPVPKGWAKVSVGVGRKKNLGVPDDLLIAEGANSRTRAMTGADFVDVGPNTRFIAGFVSGTHFTSLPDAGGNKAGQRGVVRRGFKTTEDGSALRHIAISPSHIDGVWALPEVDGRLSFDDPKSIEAYFGEPLARDVAVKKYYVREVSELTGLAPDVIEKNISFGPGPFVLQSHVAGPVGADATNVHLIGDARGNSHFLTSLGKVTGTGTHQLSLRRYWQALDSGTDPRVASAILDRRLDSGTRAWLKLGLREFNGAGGVNLGAEAVRRLKESTGGKTFKVNSTSDKYDEANDPTVNNK